jgi:hypothetical protein
MDRPNDSSAQRQRTDGAAAAQAVDVTAGSGALQRLMRRLRTRLTTLAQRARLVVIQDGDNVYIEEAVPVKCQFATASAPSDSQMTTPRPRARSCQRPICLMRLPLSAASCSGVILKNCEYPSWSLPWWNCQVIMNFIMGFFWLFISAC